MKSHENTIKNLILWIDNNLDRPLVISAIAEKSGYSKWYLQRIFKNETAQPLATYIRKKRLELVADELASTSTPIIFLAIKYGFDSQQSFTRIFTRNYGIPPGEWRLRIKNKNP